MINQTAFYRHRDRQNKAEFVLPDTIIRVQLMGDRPGFD